MHTLPRILIISCVLLTACTNSHTPSESTSTTPATTSPQPLPDVGAMIKRMITQDGCKDFTAWMRMTAENEGGKRDQVEFKIQRKYSEKRAWTFITVLSPEDDVDKAILAFEVEDEPTQATTYLAGLRKLAKFSSDRQLGYRGAKVTIQELLGMELGQYAQSAGARVVTEDESLIKVEFTQKPFRNLAFPKIVGYFRESDQQPVQFELFNDRDEVRKRVRIEEIKPIQNRMTITRVAIEDLEQKLKLKLETSKIEYDRGLPDSLFTEERLKSHVISVGQKLIQ